MLLMNRSDTEERGQKIVMSGMTFDAVDRYQDMIYRTALTIVKNPADAEDIMQEVFFKYFRTHPVLKSEEHEKAWFLRVTINEGKNLLRSAWHRKRTDADLSQLTAKEEQSRNTQVLEAVMSLPEKYRIAIYLHYYEEYSIRQIAKITEQSETAVSQQLSRGRKKLQKRLGGYGK